MLAPTLHALIANMLSWSVYPDVFKLALLHPVHKTGSVTELGNYRPISLLPVLIRMIERMLADQLYAALEKSDRISGMQFGVRREKRCEHAAHQLLD